MINVFTLTNINTKIIEGKLSKIFISEVRIILVVLRINRCTSSSQFQKVGDPCPRGLIIFLLFILWFSGHNLLGYNSSL